MDNETKGQLIAWEALAREAFKLLTPEQREAAKQGAMPACTRLADRAVSAAATKALQAMR